MPTHQRQTKVGTNLREAIKNQNLLSGEFAEKVGVSASTCSYWYKTGVTHPYSQKVSDVLGVDPKHITTKSRYRRNLTAKPRAAKPAPRSVNLELLSIIANKQLTKDQEDSLHLLAVAFAEQN